MSVTTILDWARRGHRVKVAGKTIWAGLGNRSGLHSYARTINADKWKKSGPRFAKKVDALAPGTVVELFRYAAINRDRGRWECDTVVTIQAPAANPDGSKPMPPGLLRQAVETIASINNEPVGAKWVTRGQLWDGDGAGHPAFDAKTIWRVWIGKCEYHWAVGGRDEYYCPHDDEVYGF